MTAISALLGVCRATENRLDGRFLPLRRMAMLAAQLKSSSAETALVAVSDAVVRIFVVRCVFGCGRCCVRVRRRPYLVGAMRYIVRIYHTNRVQLI